MASSPSKTDAAYEGIDAPMFFDFSTQENEGQQHQFEKAIPELTEPAPDQAPDWTNDVHMQQPKESPFSPTPPTIAAAPEPTFTVFQSAAANNDDTNQSFNASALFEGTNADFAGFAGAWSAPRISQIPQESPIAAKPQLTAFVSPNVKAQKLPMTFAAATPEPPMMFSSSSSSHHQAAETTEQQQLRQIEELRAKQAEERQQREERMMRALAGDGVDTLVRSAKPLTKPTTPKFATNKRLGKKEDIFGFDQSTTFMGEEPPRNQKRPLNSGPTVAQPFSFATNARYGEKQQQQHAVSPEESRRPINTQPTVTQPFSFATDARYGEKQAVHEESSVIQQRPKKKNAWTGKPTVPVTPQFATKARARIAVAVVDEEAEQATPQQPKSTWTGAPTIAHTPQLSTKARSRPQTVLMTTEQRREEEVLHMPKFKARPLDRAILDGTGSMGVPLIPKMQLTRPEGFDFATAARALNKPVDESAMVEQQQQQQLEPMEEDVDDLQEHQEQTMVKRKRAEPRPLTVPVTPKFATKTRSRRLQEPKQQQKKALSAEKSQRPRPARRPFTRSLTAPKPFNLATEVRGKEAKDNLRQKVASEKAQDAKRRRFRAKPVQTHFKQRGAAHHPEPRELTVPEPFALHVEQRGAVSKEVFHEQVEEEEAERREAANFKARPYKKVPSERVFVPRRSEKALTELDEFVLNSDVRAYQRREFEADLSEKRRMQAKVDAERDRERQRREDRAVREMRARMVPKARPIYYGNPIIIRPSSKPLTVPQSPAFATKKRFHRP